MRTYITNKILSFAGVFLCIMLTSIYFGHNTLQWQAILLSVIIFGYSHFFIGFYYQAKNFLRQKNPYQYFLTFGTLTIFSIFLAVVLMQYLGLAGALFLGFIYFVLHGLFNEQTMVFRQTGLRIPLIFFLALLVSILGVVLYSLPDPTFFFDKYLNFIPMSKGESQFFFQSNYTSLHNLDLVLWLSFAASIGLLFLGWLRKGFTKTSLFLLGLIALVISGVLYFGAPAYIYAYVFVVGYHFMTWFVYYITEMKKRGAVELYKFLFIHLLFITPLIYLATQFFLPYPPSYVLEIFNYQYFVVLTYIHITTSFMNDDWLKNIQSKIFTQLE